MMYCGRQPAGFAPMRTRERAPLYADQMAGVIRRGFHLEEMSLQLHVAAGVCMYPEHGRTAEELLRRSQIAIEDADEAWDYVTRYYEER